MKCAQAERHLAALIGKAGLDAPLLSARLLLAHVLGLGREKLLLCPERELARDEADRLAVLAARRLRGEPMAHILGKREFYGRDFAVDRSTLIPRPETELLVECALDWQPDRTVLSARHDLHGPLPTLAWPCNIAGWQDGRLDGVNNALQDNKHSGTSNCWREAVNCGDHDTGIGASSDGKGGTKPEQDGLLFLDAGTGSGCIGITLCLERPHWRGILLDVSAPALAVARRNATAHGCGQRLAFVLGSMDALPLAANSLDMVIANPPYISPAEMGDVMPEVLAHEPGTALFSANGGLAHCLALAAQARRVLRPGGRIFLEHGAGQGEAVRQILKDAGYRAIVTLRDLAGLERCSMGTLGQCQPDNHAR